MRTAADNETLTTCLTGAADCDAAIDCVGAVLPSVVACFPRGAPARCEDRKPHRPIATDRRIHSPPSPLKSLT